MIYFHIHRLKFIDFMVIELHWFKKKKKMKNMAKINEESTFWDIMHVLHNWSTNFCILVIFHTFFTLILLKVKSTSNWKWKWKKSYIWFSMGIDHSNPYIHSTTILCDANRLCMHIETLTLSADLNLEVVKYFQKKSSILQLHAYANSLCCVVLLCESRHLNTRGTLSLSSTGH